jgi:hypothetical protein
MNLDRMNLDRLRVCAQLGKSEFRSAGAASPRIGPGTYENPSQWLPGWIPEMWLIALQANVLHLLG